MKSLAELNAIRDKAKANMNIREDNEYTTRVLVGMATCGIAAGAKPVLTALVDEIARRNLSHVTVSQTGCIGMCQLEPIVEVYAPGKEKVTYAKVSPEKVARIVADHLVNGNVVAEYTVGKLSRPWRRKSPLRAWRKRSKWCAPAASACALWVPS